MPTDSQTANQGGAVFFNLVSPCSRQNHFDERGGKKANSSGAGRRSWWTLPICVFKSQESSRAGRELAATTPKNKRRKPAWSSCLSRRGKPAKVAVPPMKVR